MRRGAFDGMGVRRFPAPWPRCYAGDRYSSRRRRGTSRRVLYSPSSADNVVSRTLPLRAAKG